MKQLETAANVSVLLVALLISVVLTKQFLLPRPNQPTDAPLQSRLGEPTKPLKGTRLNLKGVTWNTKQPTLVMALTTYYHFCLDSTPFYHHLSEMKRQGKLHADLIAAFPEDANEASTFTVKYGFEPNKIVSTSLDSIGVEGTLRCFWSVLTVQCSSSGRANCLLLSKML